MRFLSFMFSILFLAMACDRPLIRPKGSDIEWQQRQEQQERQEEINRLDEKQLELDEQQDKELQDREVLMDGDRQHQEVRDINFTPANQ